MRLSLEGVNLRGEALPVDGADPRDTGDAGKLASARAGWNLPTTRAEVEDDES